MRRKNTMGKRRFVREHIFWGLITWIIYTKTSFQPYGNLSFAKSRWVLLAFLVGSCVLGIALNYKRGLNGWTVFFDLLWGYGLYAAFTCVYPLTGFTRCVLLVTFILADIFGLFVLLRPIELRRIRPSRRRARRQRVIFRRLELTLFSAKRIIGIAFLLLLSVYTIVYFRETSVQRPVVEEAVGEQEGLQMLRQEVWDSLTVDKRLEVIRMVMERERAHLGISNDLCLGIVPLSMGTLGYYDQDRFEILIDTDVLRISTAWEALDIICHETYHAMQDSLVELYERLDEKYKNLIVFERVREYAYEFKHYNHGQTDFDEYYEQACETDARAYAEKRLEDYKGYLGDEENEERHWGKLYGYRATGALAGNKGGFD